jgi:S1-C subfamily serine protease
VEASKVLRRIGAVIVSLSAAAATVLAARQPITWGANAAVLRINSSRCAGSTTDRVGTGFLWGSARQAVTSLHVVAGCTSFLVHSQHDNLDYRAAILRVYRKADLALLSLDAEVRATPFVETTTAPRPSDTLTAWGYGDSPMSMRSFSLRVGDIVDRHLRVNLPDDVIADVQKAGTPDLDVEILPIDDPIAAGLSGAPIYDAAGRVNGVADGGVRHGIGHASWAIPVKYLAELARSPESPNSYVVTSGNLSAAEVTRAQVYSADFIDATAPTVKCGSATLRRARVVPFVQASLSTDNPIGLIQLETFFNQPAPQFNIDVYTDAVSGATIGLPAGTGLTSNGAGCIASSPDGSLAMLIQVTAIPAGDGGQGISTAFELAAGSPAPQFWRLDPAWTNFQPAFRADGLTVVRRAYQCFYPPNQYNFGTRYLFETLAIRGRTFLGVAGFRNNDAAMYACAAGLPMPKCPGLEYIAGWMQVALSVHLATFPITAGSQTKAWTR